MNYQGAFDDVYGIYNSANSLERIKTTIWENYLEVKISFCMRDKIDEKELIDVLRCRNGI
jgi:hypothetical protein